MTHTSTIAVSITPLGKLFSDYLSSNVFAEFLPTEHKQNKFVLNYFESIKQGNQRKLYYKLLLASCVVCLRPLLSFSLPFSYLSQEDKQRVLNSLQHSSWHFVRQQIDLLKEHSIHALFKDASVKLEWNTEESAAYTSFPKLLKSDETNYDFIVIGNEGSTIASDLFKAGKKVLLIGQKEYVESTVLKRPPTSIYDEWIFPEETLEDAIDEVESDLVTHKYDHLHNVTVEKLIFDGTRVRAVETSSGTIEANCGVIIALGALETPALLLRSNIKHPELGENFQAHLSIHCLGLLPEERTQIEGDAERIEISKFEKNGIYLSSQAMSVEEMLVQVPYIGDELTRLKNCYQNLTSWVASIQTNTMGTVQITTKGAPHLFYNPTYEDMETVRAAMNKLCQILFELNATEVYPGLSGKLAILKNPNQAGDIRAISPQAQYFKLRMKDQFGTCRMGTDPKQSVVDMNFKVCELDNLYCVDGSILPTSTGVDPTLTIKALNKIAAKSILQNL